MPKLCVLLTLAAIFGLLFGCMPCQEGYEKAPGNTCEPVDDDDDDDDDDASGDDDDAGDCAAFCVDEEDAGCINWGWNQTCESYCELHFDASHLECVLDCNPGSVNYCNCVVGCIEDLLGDDDDDDATSDDDDDDADIVDAVLVWYSSDHTMEVRGVDWSASDGTVVSVSQYLTSGEIAIWDADDGDRRFFDESVGGSYRVRISPDESYFVVGSTVNQPQIHDLASGANIDDLGGCHDGDITDIKFSPDGAKILTVGMTGFSGGAKPDICIWDAATLGNLYEISIDDTYGLYAAAWNSGSSRVAALADEKIEVYNSSTGDWVTRFDLDGSWGGGPGTCMDRFAADVYMGSEESNMVFEASMSGPSADSWFTAGGRPLDMAFSPDEDYLAVSTADGDIRIRNRVLDSNSVTFQAHGGAARALAWSPDGKYLVTGGWSPGVAVWELVYQ
jgi:WD40 repeat protein